MILIINLNKYKLHDLEFIKPITDLLKDYDGKRVMIIGHRATQYALESLINKAPLEQVIPAPWKWQPGWKYELVGPV